MSFYKEFDYNESLKKDGKMITREAIKGIIIKGEQILMVYSLKNRDYKFPGGGVEKGESLKETLIREIKEECGAFVSDIGEKMGTIIEYKKARESEYDVFKMVSSYYLCQVCEKKSTLKLDSYEQELGFHPVWVNLSEAIRQNKTVMQLKGADSPSWTRRDTFVLEELKG